MGRVYSFPERRRRHPRVPLSQPVALVHESAAVATAVASNVSRGGIQVLCDRYSFHALCRPQDRGEQQVTDHIDVHLKLPVNTGLANLDLECRLAYVRTADSEEYTLGLEFVAMNNLTQVHLDRFLRETERLVVIPGS